MSPIYVVHWSDEKHVGERLLRGALARQEAIQSIVTGDLPGKIDKVDCYDTDEHVADDVSEDVAIEIANAVQPWDTITPQVRDFIEAAAGLDYTRGIRVDDKTFAAA